MKNVICGIFNGAMLMFGLLLSLDLVNSKPANVTKPLQEHVFIERYNSHENFVVQEVVKESVATYDNIVVQANNSSQLHVYANIWMLPLPVGTPVRLLKVNDHQSGESFLLAEPAE
jgi:hypothetical protein